MLWVLLCVLEALVASFEVSVPHKHLVAIRDRPAVLGCIFTPDPNFSSLVVTWQRQEDSRVVHSFYYQQDQLDRQSPEYHNRTSLYISELGKGNASLKIAAVRPKDTGWYICIVSNDKGTERALLEVTYGALYSEPRLSIHVNSQTVTVQFETEGFPKPEVSWLGEQGQNLSHHLELYDQTEDGLYSMKSSYEVQKPAIKVTFMLKNHLLSQNLQRPVKISYDDAAKRQVIIAVVVLSILCFLLFIGFFFLTVWRRKKKSRESPDDIMCSFKRAFRGFFHCLLAR